MLLLVPTGIVTGVSALRDAEERGGEWLAIPGILLSILSPGAVLACLALSAE